MNTNNRVQLTGNLGRDPEILTFENGGKLAKFSLATREEVIRSGEITENTQWHNISARGKLVEQIQAEFKKGSFVSVEGKLVTRMYEDKAGQKKYFTEVIIHNARLNNTAS